jgi:ribonucleoside-diphosphate reductase alpha subunit
MHSNNSHSGSQMYVIKRNGEKEKVMFDKITLRISKLISEDEEIYIDPTIIAMKVINSIYSGISTEELDLESAKICSNMVTINPIYGRLAGRILVSNLHKKTLNSFVDKMEIIQKECNLLDEDWLKWVTDNKKEIDSMINYERDYCFDYFGYKTLERSYLLKNHTTNAFYERPQDMFMRVASHINMGNLDKVKITYDLLSTKAYTHASPTLFNAGTKRPQLSSCFLLNTNDSLEGITKTWSDVSQISKWAGGIGLHISNIRAKGSIIRSTNGTSSGIIPMLQVYNNIARYINQAGKRKGSFAIYLEPHHADIEDFLELRKNTGAETERARDLFLALWISNLFMEQVEKNGDWYLMCPDECPNLNEVYGDAYNELYWKYVSEKKYRKIVKARKLMEKIMDSQLETGTPYMLFKDHVNEKSNQKNIGIIKSSNLCSEIVEVSNNEEHATCNLASICLNKFLKPFKSNQTWVIYTKPNCKYCNWSKNYFKFRGYDYIEKEFNEENREYLRKNKEQSSNKESVQNFEFTSDADTNNCKGNACTYTQGIKITYPQIFYGTTYIGGFDDMIQYTADDYDYNELWETAYIATINLNHVIDINYYPTSETKCSNMRNRPLGLGIQGLADTLIAMKTPYESDMAIRFNKNVMETIYHASLTASMNIAHARHDDMKEFIEYYIARNNASNNAIINLPEYYDKKFKLEDKEMNEIYHQHKINKCEMKLTSHYGSYSSYHSNGGSPASHGLLQFDLWKEEGSVCNWGNVRDGINEYGLRNSLLIALMPTASTSQIMGNNECFEWFTSNIYTRRTLAGDFSIVNKHLVSDLLSIGEWNENTKQIIMANDGNVNNTNLFDIPTNFKELYKTIWEIKQIWVLKHARARAPFVDQTQSMNIFMAVPDYNKLLNCHMWAWKNGLKTGMYYLRTKPAEGANKVTVDPNMQKKINDAKNDTLECESCSA